MRGRPQTRLEGHGEIAFARETVPLAALRRYVVAQQGYTPRFREATRRGRCRDRPARRGAARLDLDRRPRPPDHARDARRRLRRGRRHTAPRATAASSSTGRTRRACCRSRTTRSSSAACASLPTTTGGAASGRRRDAPSSGRCSPVCATRARFRCARSRAAAGRCGAGSPPSGRSSTCSPPGRSRSRAARASSASTTCRSG